MAKIFELLLRLWICCAFVVGVAAPFVAIGAACYWWWK